jgi:hypothetical protein
MYAGSGDDLRFPDLRQAYEKLAAEWIKLTVGAERTHGDPPE